MENFFYKMSTFIFGNFFVAGDGLLRDQGWQGGGGGWQEGEEAEQGDREADSERQTGDGDVDGEDNDDH